MITVWIQQKAYNNYKYECSISGLPNIGRTHESSKTKIYIHIIVRKLNTQISKTTKQNKQKRTRGTVLLAMDCLPLHSFCYTSLK